MERLLTWAGFSLVLAVLCLIRPNVGRIVVGFFFLALAVAVNIVTTLTNPASYTAWVDTIWIPIYRDLYAAWVACGTAKRCGCRLAMRGAMMVPCSRCSPGSSRRSAPPADTVVT